MEKDKLSLGRLEPPRMAGFILTVNHLLTDDAQDDTVDDSEPHIVQNIAPHST